MSPQCIDTTASHRVSNIFVWRALVLAEAIRAAASANGIGVQGEPRPSAATLTTAIDLIAEVVPFYLLGDPDIDLFYGEIHLTWNKGQKQVLLMSFPNRGPLIHHYLRIPGAPSQHDIEAATPVRLAHWLRWLNA